MVEAVITGFKRYPGLTRETWWVDFEVHADGLRMFAARAVVSPRNFRGKSDLAGMREDVIVAVRERALEVYESLAVDNAVDEAAIHAGLAGIRIEIPVPADLQP